MKNVEDLSNESVEVLRERLNAMKRLMAERNAQSNSQTNSSSSSSTLGGLASSIGAAASAAASHGEEAFWSKSHGQHRTQSQHSGIIDGNFLSFAFGGALLVIITVSVYAFYNLYHAILKKFPSHHTEL